MKSISVSFLGLLISAVMFIGSAAAQTQVVTPTESLGDYARDVRKDKKPATAKQYDNDNLPVNDKLSIVGNTPAVPSATAPTDGSEVAPAAAADADKKPDIKPSQTPQERQKGYDEWKAKIA